MTVQTGPGEIVDGPWWGCTCARASFPRDDVHELHLWLQPHPQTTPLQCMWQGQTHSLLLLECAWWLILPYLAVTLEDLSLLLHYWYRNSVEDANDVFIFTGQVVCRACSRNRYPLKYLKDRVAKVCDHCYAELRKRGESWLSCCRGAPCACFRLNNITSFRFSVGGSVSAACDNSSPRTRRASRPLSAVFQSLQPPSLWKSRKSTSPLSQVDYSPSNVDTLFKSQYLFYKLHSGN